MPIPTKELGNRGKNCECEKDDRYGEVAVGAVKLIHTNKVKDPAQAWCYVAGKIFSTASSREKNCPQSAFLGLCEEGLVKEVPAGKYTRSKKNKEYAIRAIEELRKTAGGMSSTDLWNKIGNKDIAHNSQMNVVLALWNANMITR